MSHVFIYLNKGQSSLVDGDDFGWLSKFRWYAEWCEDTKSYYACRQLVVRSRKEPGGQRLKKLRMHREILGLVHGDGKVVDHINRNTLDNRRCNLRVVTHSQNSLNRIRGCDVKSAIPGVHWHSKNERWIATITVDRLRINLGSRRKQEEAISLRRHAELKYFGEYCPGYHAGTGTLDQAQSALTSAQNAQAALTAAKGIH